MLILGTLTNHIADQTIHSDLFDFIAELFCTKQKTVSLVENSFARSCLCNDVFVQCIIINREELV